MRGYGFIKTLKAERGQTMIDLLIALALLAVAIASSLTLANTSFGVGQESGRRSQAASLGSRELEGLRALRDGLVKNPIPPQTLWTYFGPGNSQYDGTNSCYQVILVRDSTAIGWHTAKPAAVNSFTAYSSSDENGDPNFAQYSNFKRLVKVCQGKDYSSTGGYTASTDVYLVEVDVQWQEASGPTRQQTMHTVLVTPKG